MKTSSGFTLIEVLIALSIFAVAVASLSGAMRNNVTNTNYLKDKTLAHWIASNKMVEFQMTDSFPPTAERTDKVEFAGREWIVTSKAEATTPQMRQLTISVGVEVDGDPNYFTSLSGYFSDTP